MLVPDYLGSGLFQILSTNVKPFLQTVHGGTMKKNPTELTVIARIERQLETLDPGTKSRILRYLLEKTQQKENEAYRNKSYPVESQPTNGACRPQL